MALDIAAAPFAPSFAGMPLEQVLPALDVVPPAAAAGTYRVWLAANPASPQRFAAWFNLGVLLAQDGARAEAMEAYRQALALKPDLYQASVNLGLALEAEGQAEAALSVWQGAPQRGPRCSTSAAGCWKARSVMPRPSRRCMPAC